MTTWTLAELAHRFDGRLTGDPGLRVRPVPAEADDPHGIAFCEAKSYLKRATKVGALLLPPGLASPGKPTIHVDDPRAAFGVLLAELDRPMPLADGVHPTAVVDPRAVVDPSANIGAYAVVEAGAVLGPRVRVLPFCYVGENCRIGADSVLYPHVVLCRDVRLGERCSVHPGAVVGVEGFGFRRGEEGWRRVPHVGEVHVGDDAEIRALASVERATSGVTDIGRGAKIGNLAQVGHNARIHEHAMMVPMSGIGGSSVLGRRSVMGGGSLAGDHVDIADDVSLGARACVTRDVRDAGVYRGYPARPLAQQLRVEAVQPRVPDVLRRLERLEHLAAARDAQPHGPSGEPGPPR
ncbi:UDP-3-O-(3-hydroxymyristoyl)glucosamine N-acyltransferase [Streptomyces sp. NPDC017638]|uniref:UDP-3-O-(3-hydroxymyristoyl)glucosamine N-acyltransferase n=1 Tax=Streptomyces sp. NPDC017638 TaxID=3365004 RepID=UPI0037882AE0